MKQTVLFVMVLSVSRRVHARRFVISSNAAAGGSAVPDADSTNKGLLCRR